MKKIITSLLFITILTCFKTVPVFGQMEPFAMRVVDDSLNFPWEITYGPNDSLFITEARGYKVYRMSAFTGIKKQLLNINSQKNFTESTPGTWPQGGLMGMALHPDLYSTDMATRNAKPWVYMSYVYKKVAENYFVTRIVRYDYINDTLINPVIIHDSIPGSSDHNSGRMVIGPDMKLYYTVGDMGAGKSPNAARTNHAQDIENYEGKLLRINLEPDGDAGLDAWVPNDNPDYDGGTITSKDFIYSRGHRNAQGIVWANIGGVDRLYNCEHGDKSDDEINIIQPGKNYGWPKMMGFCDGNYDTYTGWPGLTNEAAFCNDLSNEAVEPITSYDPVSGALLNTLGTNSATFTTLAPSSLDMYQSNTIPGWKNSLLMTTLKRGTLFRIKLNSNGDAIVTDTIPYFLNNGRLRDLCISPNGLKIYVATDNKGRGNKGRILEFTYSPVLSLGDDNVTVSRKREFKIYPNPTADILSVEIQRNVIKPLRYELFDISGKLISTGKTYKDKFEVGLATFKSGTYIFKLFNGYDSMIATEKVIITR